jgi:hypothetical protein
MEGRFILHIPLSIVIPVKNEAGNLPACLESVGDFSDVSLLIPIARTQHAMSPKISNAR